MAHAETCPLCGGTGNRDKEDTSSCPISCHGCYGKGWVSVEDTSYFGDSPMYQWPVYPNYTSSGMSRFHNIDYVLVR